MHGLYLAMLCMHGPQLTWEIVLSISMQVATKPYLQYQVVLNTFLKWTIASHLLSTNSSQYLTILWIPLAIIHILQQVYIPLTCHLIWRLSKLIG